jgi:competence protein ComEA
VTRRLTCIALLFFLAFSACGAPAVEITLTTRTTACQGQIFIDGSVNNPGLYPFTADDRLADLIRAAGGLAAGADASQVVLSFGAPGTSQKIDLNRAGAWLLEALPGIGEVTARNIVSYREANGFFRGVSDLLKVPGIGPAVLDSIAAYVTVGGE